MRVGLWRLKYHKIVEVHHGGLEKGHGDLRFQIGWESTGRRSRPPDRRGLVFLKEKYKLVDYLQGLVKGVDVSCSSWKS